jgi:hypothetical protein
MFRPVAVLASALALIVLPASARAADMLPDLTMQKPSDVSTEVLPDGRKVLRYSAVILNVGDGPFELSMSRPDSASEFVIGQRLDSDQGRLLAPTRAEAHWSDGTDGHHHFHVSSLETGVLTDPRTGEQRMLAKHGFCFMDTSPLRGNDTSARVYTPSGCGYGSPESWLSLTMGLSVSWKDEYFASFPGQFIDVTGLPSGRYALSVSVNTELGFLEKDYTNNSQQVMVRVR